MVTSYTIVSQHELDTDGAEARLVGGVLSTLESLASKHTGSHCQVWINGKVKAELLLAAIDCCINEDKPRKLFLPAISVNSPIRGYVGHWFTADMPTGIQATKLSSTVDWADGTMVLCAAMYSQADVDVLWSMPWQDAQAQLLRSVGTQATVIFEGYFDTERFGLHFAGVSYSEMLIALSKSGLRLL